jgi:predicted RNA polymerase sigma factor
MLEQMIEKGSEDPFVYYAKAMELRKMEQLEDALQAFANVERRFPDYVPTFLMAGQVAEQLGRVDEARRWFERGIQVARDAGNAHAAHELEAALEELE